MSDTEQDPLAGTPYRGLRRLGEGTHGIVVEAEQTALRRRVVVKLLREKYAGREDVVDRLRLEAQAVAQLSARTPHVVSIIDFGRTPQGRPYIVMERLEGHPLDRELERRPSLPAAESVVIAGQILEGLAVAHEAGIVHRDVKPANVFLCRGKEGERVVKLIDFGLAKLVGERLQVQAATGPLPLAKPTDEGMMMGTPRYLSPEQARGQQATPSSDLYSAGAVLYTMLAGRDPFGHLGNVLDLVKAHLTEEPRPPSKTALHPIPEALDRVVLKSLSKRPEDRYPDARTFRAALEAALRAAPKRWERTERMDPTAPLPSPAAAPQGRASVEPVSKPAPSPAAAQRPSAPGRVRVRAALAVLAALASVAVFFVVRVPQLRLLPAEPAAPVVATEPLTPAVPPAQTAQATAKDETASDGPARSASPAAAPAPSASASAAPAPGPRPHVGARPPAPLPVTPLPVTPLPPMPPPAAPHRVFGTEN